MRRAESEPIVKVTLNLFAGDKEKLQRFHGKLGYGKVIRELVRGHIRRTEAKAEQRQEA